MGLAMRRSGALPGPWCPDGAICLFVGIAGMNDDLMVVRGRKLTPATGRAGPVASGFESKRLGAGFLCRTARVHLGEAVQGL